MMMTGSQCPDRMAPRPRRLVGAGGPRRDPPRKQTRTARRIRRKERMFGRCAGAPCRIRSRGGRPPIHRWPISGPLLLRKQPARTRPNAARRIPWKRGFPFTPRIVLAAGPFREARSGFDRCLQVDNPRAARARAAVAFIVRMNIMLQQGTGRKVATSPGSGARAEPVDAYDRVCPRSPAPEQVSPTSRLRWRRRRRTRPRTASSVAAHRRMHHTNGPEC
jgi:hypothetical protein